MRYIAPSRLGDPEADVEDLFPWYQSTAGPGLSMTLTNQLLTVLPLANLVLAKEGFNILPGQLNVVVTLAVFAWFAGRAAYGYVRAKQTLGVALMAAQRQLSSLKAEMANSKK